MHKFVPWSRIGILCNEHTRYAPLDPKHSIGAFRTVWVHFGFVLLLHKTRCKTGWTGAVNSKVRGTKSHRNVSQWTHPIHPHWTLNACFGSFCSVWLHFGLFRYCRKLDAKWAEMVELMQKFVAWCRIGIFRNERTRSTQLDPKLMCLVCFVVFGRTWQSFVTTWNLVQTRLNRCN